MHRDSILPVLTLSLIAALFLTLVDASEAEAFFGLYVAGAEAKTHPTTHVVMMREGKRTVLSMQNNYRGPLSDFTVLIPVPTVLHREHFTLLPHDIFRKVDQTSSPRLTEYWEHDPCAPATCVASLSDHGGGSQSRAMFVARASQSKGVRVESRFILGEYEIAVLGANDSTALKTWLHQNRYTLPQNAEYTLDSYIKQGMYFFAVKINVDKVKFADGQVRLSPLRFHYDSDTFSLPTRLGLLNAKGKQDLVVHILARNQRYEVANAKNVTIPTNITVTEDTKRKFGEFYASLLDRTLAVNPSAVVTEYAWDASTCDPCPKERLASGDILKLGAEVLSDTHSDGFVLTRLHARYDEDERARDLMFRAATPIVGGHRVVSTYGVFRRGATVGKTNRFQGHYIIHHPWRGAAVCTAPKHGIWGGSSTGLKQSTTVRTTSDVSSDLQSPNTLRTMVHQHIPELRIWAQNRRTFYRRR